MGWATKLSLFIKIKYYGFSSSVYQTITVRKGEIRGKSLSSSSSSSSCSLRVRHFSCSLILKVELVLPSLLRPSHVPSSFRSVSQCLSWLPICVHPLYVLQPLFLVLFYFLYYVLCSRFFP